MNGQVIKFVLADLTGSWTRTDNGNIISYQPTSEVGLEVVRESATGNPTTYFYTFGQAAEAVLVVDDVIHILSRFTKSLPGDQITNPSGSPLPFHRPVDPGSKKVP